MIYWCVSDCSFSSATCLNHFCDRPVASRSGQSHGFSLDSDEREGDEPTIKQRPGEERRERPEESQRSSWERRTSTDDRRRKREDSEPRLFMACDDGQDTQDPLEGADKSGMTGNCNQAHVNLYCFRNLIKMCPRCLKNVFKFYVS